MNLEAVESERLLWGRSFGKRASYSHIAPVGPGNLMHWASQSHRAEASVQHSISNMHTDDISFQHGLPPDVMEAIEVQLSMSFSEVYTELPEGDLSDSPIAFSGLPEGTDSPYPEPPENLGHGQTAAFSHEDSVTQLYNTLAEQIWRFNDQKASLYLQQRLQHAIPKEYEVIHEVVFLQIELLMVHRFGNFLVQCMLELARPEDALRFAGVIEGRVASLSKDQFCCHVIQKLLEVSPLVLQARLAAELLDDAVETMTSPFGTHVWQKLFHLPWSNKLPSIVSLANNAVHSESADRGWMLIAKNDAGCATIKSLLNSNLFDKDCQECIEQLLSNFQTLMKHSYGSALICKLAVVSSTRARTMALVFSKAYDYCKHPVSSRVLVQLIRLKIPSFPARLSGAIAAYRNDLSENEFGSYVVRSLESMQKRPN